MQSLVDCQVTSRLANGRVRSFCLSARKYNGGFSPRFMETTSNFYGMVDVTDEGGMLSSLGFVRIIATLLKRL